MRNETQMIFWSIVLVLWLAAGTALFGGATAKPSTSTEAGAPAAQEKQNYTYNGGKNEPDNPACPAPNSNYNYTQHGHNCAPSGEQWSSHFWMYGPGAHQPGADSASYAWRSWPVTEDFDMEYYQFVAIAAPWGDFSECAVSDAQAAGIDRKNDNSPNDFHTTASDQGMVSDIQNSQINEKYGYWQFAGPDDPANRGIHLNSTDSFVAAVGNCFKNPSQEGWYRMTIWFNGTGYDGKKVAWKGMGQWTYICGNCQSRQDAYNKFGPPGTNAESKWKDTTVSKSNSGGGGNSDTATQTATATDGSGGSNATDGGGGSTATDGGGGGSTATATDGGGSTATATNGGDGGTTATATGGGGGDDSTPTDQSGPGFGILAAIAALILTLFGVLHRFD